MSMPTLRIGSDHDSVWVIETKLRNLGFFKGIPSTVFDQETETAVKEYQRFAGIASDGIVGPQTYGALYGRAVKPKVAPEGGRSEKRPAWTYAYIIALTFLMWQLTKAEKSHGRTNQK